MGSHAITHLYVYASMSVKMQDIVFCSPFHASSLCMFPWLRLFLTCDLSSLPLRTSYAPVLLHSLSNSGMLSIFDH